MNRRNMLLSSFIFMMALVGYGENKTVGGYEFVGPYKHENLTVYFLKSNTAEKEKKYVTLAEAIENKWLTVHETGDVNKLSVENISDKTIFIQSGDIVRGGKQDRVLSVDLVVTPQSGKIGIDSFCVEQGRWQARTGESISTFNASTKKAFGKELRNACRSSVKNQGYVWSSVEKNQQTLNDNLEINVKDEKSASSLQLTLENEKLQKTAESYMKIMNAALLENKETCGFVFLVNNKFSNAEIFNNIPLFQENAKALLEAAANEAIASANIKSEDEDKDWMKTFFNENKGKEKVLKESKMNYIQNDFETYYTIDNQHDGKTIHRSIDIKVPETVQQNLPNNLQNNLQNQTIIDNVQQVEPNRIQE